MRKCYFLAVVFVTALRPAMAQIIANDTALIEQLTPDSLKFEATAVAAKGNGFRWGTTISYSLANNSGMNLYMGIMMGSVAIGSCSQANAARGGLQFLPGPNAIAYSVDMTIGPPRPMFVPAGAKVAGAITMEDCAAPNPGSPTAPLSLSLMLGRTDVRKAMVQVPLSAETPIRQVRE